MTATRTKPTAAVRAFLVALSTGQPTNPTNPTITAALRGGWVEYRAGERVQVGQGWRTVGDGYFLTDAGRAVIAPKPVGSAEHARGCRCPRCVAEHVRAGCRSVHCHTCGF